MTSFKARLKNRKGFSLVETIASISILGILAVMAIPDLDTAPVISLDSAAIKIKADLRLSQSIATTTGQSHGFRVTSLTTYEIYNVSTGTIVTSPFDNLPMQEDLSEDFGQAQFAATTYQTEFDSRGRPSLTGDSLIQIQDGTNIQQIQITPTSGFIKLLETPIAN